MTSWSTPLPEPELVPGPIAGHYRPLPKGTYPDTKEGFMAAVCWWAGYMEREGSHQDPATGPRTLWELLRPGDFVGLGLTDEQRDLRMYKRYMRLARAARRYARN